MHGRHQLLERNSARLDRVKNLFQLIFRQWAPARWARRMRMMEEFPLDDEGRASVKKSGLYYIYAQVNYLDEHDVNAFQVYINEDPYLLCTVMTHTR